MPADLSFIWFTVSIALVGSYAFLLMVFFIVLVSRSQNITIQEALHISVLIPFKNEGEILEKRIENAKSLQQCKQVLEVIFINDHSTDLTPIQLNGIFQNTSITLVHLPPDASGKKAAIHFGANRALGAWILTSDADTQIDSDLFDILAQNVNLDLSCMILPVRPAGNGGGVRSLFDLEFMALQAVGLASAKMHMPLLANGAALFYRKETYFKAASQRTDWHISGGDDLFTVFSIARKAGRRAVTALIANRPFVHTEFPQTFKPLWHQRLRWIQKVPGVGGIWFTGVAWLVFTVNVVLVTSWIISGHSEMYYAAGFITVLKTLPELFILGWAVLYFQRRETAWWIIPGMLIYPFYLTALILSGMFIKPAWK